MKTTYVARCERDEDGIWAGVINLEKNRSVISDGPTLERTRARLREALALTLDCEEDDFDVELDVELPERTLALLRDSKKAAQVSDAALEASTLASLEAVRSLSSAGLSQRDAGELLGVSRQRVNQLLAKANARQEDG